MRCSERNTSDRDGQPAPLATVSQLALALALPLALLLAWPAVPAWAADHGAIGPTYEISEPDMLAWIEAKVAAKVRSGEARRLQQQATERIRQRLLQPEPLASVTRAIRPRTTYLDPSFTVTEPVTDGAGRTLVAAGTRINPLDHVGLTRPLVFFDGRDARQVQFARAFLDARGGLAHPVLVGGSYFELMRQWKRVVYFDQRGALVRQLGIKAVPAVVVQEGRRLRIDEIPR